VNSQVALGDEHIERVSFHTSDLEPARAPGPHRFGGGDLQEFEGKQLHITLNVQGVFDREFLAHCSGVFFPI
jgi:hypothetical protein